MGSHHACRPSITITAGTSVIRTRKASTKTPMARPNAICWMVAVPLGMKATKTLTMMSAAAVTTRAEAWNPRVTASCGSPECTKSSRIAETRNIS